MSTRIITNNPTRSTSILYILLQTLLILLSLFSTTTTTFIQPTNALSSLKTTSATTARKIPIVICPGFGNDSIDYDRPLNQPPSKGLRTILSNQGLDINSIYTIPIQRREWIKVGLGLFDIPNFYLNKARPDGLGYGWYLRKLKECVKVAYEESGGQKVLLIGHSAGGWLARAAMGDGVWCYDEVDNKNDNEIMKTSDLISGLVTLGAIHRVPEDEKSCVTRGALKFVQENYPGAHLKDDGIKYISVGGNAIVGCEDVDGDNNRDTMMDTSDVDRIYSVRGEGSASKVAFTSYKAVCGNGNVVGDGVVPLQWSLLEGSRQIELDGILHSINEAGTTIPTDRWYGSENAIKRWLPIVLNELYPNENLSEGGDNKDIFSGVQKWASTLVGLGLH